jgi:hypothetical protein
VAGLLAVWSDCACDQPSPWTSRTSITRVLKRLVGAKEDVHVGKDARRDEKRTGHHQQPSENVSAAPEHYHCTEQHRYKCATESGCAIEAPVGTDHARLVGQKISSDASHCDAHQELTEAARRSATSFKERLSVGGRISNLRPVGMSAVNSV